MDDTTELRNLHVAPIFAPCLDRWRLTDPYVQQAWVEVLGPTASLLARQFGRIIEGCPDGLVVDRGDVRVVIGVESNVALRALERLHRCDVVYFASERCIVAVSEFAPSVPGPLVSRLSRRRPFDASALGGVAASCTPLALGARVASCGRVV